eukprot:1160247-Pelagomonas_calceolata.AAC.4
MEHSVASCSTFSVASDCGRSMCNEWHGHHKHALHVILVARLYGSTHNERAHELGWTGLEHMVSFAAGFYVGANIPVVCAVSFAQLSVGRLPHGGGKQAPLHTNSRRGKRRQQKQPKFPAPLHNISSKQSIERCEASTP